MKKRVFLTLKASLQNLIKKKEGIKEMLREFMFSKIHRATITQSNLEYMGSITIDSKLRKLAKMKINEKVDIYNLDNGSRFSTYIIEGEENSGIIGINGAAANLVEVGHRIIIVGYCLLNEEEMQNHHSTVLLVEDSENKKIQLLDGE